MPKLINMHDAKSSLSVLVKQAAAGEDILIARNGKPIAMLTRLPSHVRPTLLGAFKGKIHMAEDFDAMLPEFESYV